MSDPIAMVQAFAELRYGVVVHMRENSVKYGHNFTTKFFNAWQMALVSRLGGHWRDAGRGTGDGASKG